MPFTGSHPAAVLPLMRLGLVPSALVIGSMVPDLPYYLPVSLSSATTHSARGVLGLDLVLGFLAFAVWQVLVVPLAVASAPVAVRSRLAPGLPVPWRHHLRGPGAVLLVVVSLWIGATTHVCWDAFTHNGRWGARHLPWLAQMHGPLAGYRWAQYASGVVGAGLILNSLRLWWVRTPVADQRSAPQPIQALPRTGTVSVWIAIGLVTLAGAVAGGVGAGVHRDGIAAALFDIATWGGSAGMFAVLVAALGHALITEWSRRRERSGQPA